MNDKRKHQTQTAIRLTDELLERVDRLAERMSAAGVPITRADVHRLAVLRGVERLEAERKKR